MHKQEEIAEAELNFEAPGTLSLWRRQQETRCNQAVEVSSWLYVHVSIQSEP